MLRLFALAVVLAIPASAQEVAVTVLPGVDIPDDAYIGIADGNDGTGADAGMVCADLDFSAESPIVVTAGRLTMALTHTWLGDLTVKLQSPSGVILPVMVRPAGDLSDPATDDGSGSGVGDSSNLDVSVPITFFDGAPVDAELMGSGLDSGQTVCGNDNRCEYAPNPSAAAGQPGTIASFAGFAGEPSLGVWTVCVGDAVSADIGTFDGVTLALSGDPVAVEDDASGEFAFGLIGANPLGTTTALGLRATASQTVRATLHDLLGREVAVLHDGGAVAGQELRIGVDASALPAGTYLVRVVGERFSATQSLTVAR